MVTDWWLQINFKSSGEYSFLFGSVLWIYNETRIVDFLSFTWVSLKGSFSSWWLLYEIFLALEVVAVLSSVLPTITGLALGLGHSMIKWGAIYMQIYIISFYLSSYLSIHLSMSAYLSICLSVGHRTFKTNVLIIHRWKESTLRCMMFLSVHNSELYKNIGVR